MIFQQYIIWFAWTAFWFVVLWFVQKPVRKKNKWYFCLAGFVAKGVLATVIAFQVVAINNRIYGYFPLYPADSPKTPATGGIFTCGGDHWQRCADTE